MSTLTPDQRSYAELIVVCGPPRSGTTWLNRQLCNLPTSFPFLPECSLITEQIDLYKRMLSYESTRFQAYFSNRENLLGFYRDNVARLLDQVARFSQKSDAKTLVIKDPLLCLYFEHIKDIFPPHKLVVIVRDPRDVLASMKNVFARKGQKWKVRASASELLTYFSLIEDYQRRADKDCIFVRYEDLVAGKTTKLQDFLQKKIDNVAVSQIDVSTLKKQIDSSDPYYSELYLQPTTKEKIGSYAKILSTVEIAYIEDVFAGEMEHWGYHGTYSISSKILHRLRKMHFKFQKARNLFK